jgi:hypothetical protein
MSRGAGRLPGVRRPSAIPASGAALLAAVLVLSACGSDNADNSFGTFTDCTTIGPVATVQDPAGDQAGRPAGKAPQRQGDLTRLRVARRGDKLCVEFRAAADVKPAVAYVLAMRPDHAETPLVQLEATVLSGESPSALLQSRAADDFRKVDAEVGIRGDRLSVLIDRAPFAAEGLGSLFDAFRYQGRAATVTSDDGHQTDCLPACT